MTTRRRNGPQIGPPPIAPGGGGGGGSTAVAPANGETKDWWMNPLYWAGAFGVLLILRGRRRK